MPEKRPSPFEALTCIKCGENKGCIGLDLDDLITFRCRECENQFTREEVESTVAIWGRCLTWIDMAYPKVRSLEDVLPGLDEDEQEGGAT